MVRIDLPPLRARPEDVPVLVAHFCEKHARPGGTVPRISAAALAVLSAAPWPGNVRQLENAIERACVTARDEIQTKDLPPDLTAGATPRKSAIRPDVKRPLPDQLAELVARFERAYLRRALRRTRGHVGKCATLAGLSRRSVTEKIALYQIDKGEFKD